MRRTGRTTRLLREAVRLASEGKAVFVVSVGNRLLNMFRYMPEAHQTFQSHPVDRNQYGHVWTKGSLVFLSSGSSVIDWESLTIPGMRGMRNGVLLVDHYAIEEKFKKHLEMLHRYDKEPDISPAQEVKFTKEQYAKLIEQGKNTPNLYCPEDDNL
jgi:hypothetical protein